MSRKPKPVDFSPVDDFPEGHHHYGKQRCRAWNGNQGRQCLAIARNGFKVCRKHGGRTPSGVASPNWKHGRYSKVIRSARLLDQYEEFIQDPELLALNDEIGLTRARLAELLEKVASAPDAGSSWRELQKTFQTFEKLQREAERLEGVDQARKLAEANGALQQVRAMIWRGVADWAAWDEIVKLSEHTRRLSDSEQKRRMAGEFSLQLHDVVALFDYVVNLINDVVTDPRQKARLSDGLRRFNSGMDGEQALIPGRVGKTKVTN